MWETIRGYLTFTRKERYGVLFLLVLVCILFILPYFFRRSVGDPDPAAYERMKEGIEKFDSRQPDSSRVINHANNNYFQKQFVSEKHDQGERDPIKATLFYFDPNKTNGNEWQRLGISSRLTQTILHYVEKGGRFKSAADLRKLYGLKSSDYERLAPFVRIANPEKTFPFSPVYKAKPDYQNVRKTDSFFRLPQRMKTAGESFIHRNKKFEITDINQADSNEWQKLPGIGEKLASRIVHFREKLGGFYGLDQVGETFGLPDSTYQKIKPYLRLNPVALQQININSATKEILQTHPYIRWQMAKAIIDYRVQHGEFQSVDQLRQITRIDPAQFDKMKPYLVVKP